MQMIRSGRKAIRIRFGVGGGIRMQMARCFLFAAEKWVSSPLALWSLSLLAAGGVWMRVHGHWQACSRIIDLCLRFVGLNALANTDGQKERKEEETCTWINTKFMSLCPSRVFA